MTTDYDKIAREYQGSKLQPWRTHVEQYTLLSLASQVQGLQTLDLACGEGYYSDFSVDWARNSSPASISRWR
jgi:hypothetical protein